MKKILPWLSLGMLAAAMGGTSFACSSDDSSGGGGSSGAGTGGLLEGGAATGGGGFGAQAGGGSGGTAAGGGTAGTGGGTQTALGRACATDAQCGDGLFCLLANSGEMDGTGPAKGYCTADCSSDAAICDPLDPNGVCLQFENGKGFCMQGCTFGPTSLTQFNPNKCHGRSEVACSALFNDQGQFSIAACLPTCNSDADCGSGLFCDPGNGRCTATPVTGKEVGEKCTQPDPDAGADAAAPDECKGNCIGLVYNSGEQPFTTLCAESCTFGASPQCGWNGPGTPAPGFCLYSSTAIGDNGGPGIGDRGSCARLCNCNTDCANADVVCRPFAGTGLADLENLAQKKGYCSGPKEDDGGTSPGIPVCNGGPTDAGPTDAGGGG